MWYEPDVLTRRQTLTRLDDLLTHVTQMRKRPAYRQRLLSATGLDGEGTMRVLRAIQLELVEGNPSIGDVAERLKLEHSSASRAVDAAASLGLVVKRTSPDDARRTELALTEAGMQAVERLNVVRVAVLEELTGGWEIHRIEELTDLLEGLCDAFDALEARLGSTPSEIEA